MNFDLSLSLGNTGVWYKSVESNTGSPIFEQELEVFHSVELCSPSSSKFVLTMIHELQFHYFSDSNDDVSKQVLETIAAMHSKTILRGSRSHAENNELVQDRTYLAKDHDFFSHLLLF